MKQRAERRAPAGQRGAHPGGQCTGRRITWRIIFAASPTRSLDQPLTRLGDCLLANLLSSPPQGAWQYDQSWASLSLKGSPGQWPVIRCQAVGWSCSDDVTEARFIGQQLQRQERSGCRRSACRGHRARLQQYHVGHLLYAQMTMQAPGLSARERAKCMIAHRPASHACHPDDPADSRLQPEFSGRSSTFGFIGIGERAGCFTATDAARTYRG